VQTGRGRDENEYATMWTIKTDEEDAWGGGGHSVHRKSQAGRENVQLGVLEEIFYRKL
jgi:hypothetical protein